LLDSLLQEMFWKKKFIEKEKEENGHIVERDQNHNTNTESAADQDKEERYDPEQICKVSYEQLGQYRRIHTPNNENGLASNYSSSESSRRDSRDSGIHCNEKKKREGKDEKLAREKGITKFIEVRDIINIPMDEFNEKLEQFKTMGMTEDQSTTAKDIRRRGKNKNAAQNCRKRANDRLDNLKGDVQESKKRKDDLWNQYQQVDQELKRERKFASELEEIILRSQEKDPDIYYLMDDIENNELFFIDKRLQQKASLEIVRPIPQKAKARERVGEHPRSSYSIYPHFPHQVAVARSYLPGIIPNSTRYITADTTLSAVTAVPLPVVPPPAPSLIPAFQLRHPASSQHLHHTTLSPGFDSLSLRHGFEGRNIKEEPQDLRLLNS